VALVTYPLSSSPQWDKHTPSDSLVQEET